MLLLPSNFLKKKKKKTGFLIIFLFFIAIILLFSYVYSKNVRNNYEAIISGSSSLINNPTQTISTYSDIIKLASLWKDLAYSNSAKYYLILFQNSTEIRPTGGFIGSYAVVKLHNGQIDILDIDDSYNVDKFAIDKMKEPLPIPLAKYLQNIKYWYFRDSNWDPDFKLSTNTILKFFEEEIKYTDKENLKNIKFDGVVGVTPFVIEEILGVIGEVEAEGVIFTKENFLEKLEYEVEYGYYTRGIEKEERKDIIGTLSKNLVKKVLNTNLTSKLQLAKIAKKELDKKNILIFSKDDKLRIKIEKENWAGRIAESSNKNDYIFLVDANLASLKTDLHIKRRVDYFLECNNDICLASLMINYFHFGNYDWRTTRYRTYSRVYLPEKIEVTDGFVQNKNGIKGELAGFNTYNEKDKSIIEYYLEIAPQADKTVVFKYKLPKALTNSFISAKKYSLIVQKQPGILNYTFFVDFKFNDVLKSLKSIMDKDFIFEEPLN